MNKKIIARCIVFVAMGVCLMGFTVAEAGMRSQLKDKTKASIKNSDTWKKVSHAADNVADAVADGTKKALKESCDFLESSKDELDRELDDACMRAIREEPYKIIQWWDSSEVTVRGLGRDFNLEEVNPNEPVELQAGDVIRIGSGKCIIESPDGRHFVLLEGSKFVLL